MPVSEPFWREVESAFADLAPRTASDRAQRLGALRMLNASLAAEVESLLEAHDEATARAWIGHLTRTGRRSARRWADSS